MERQAQEEAEKKEKERLERLQREEQERLERKKVRHCLFLLLYDDDDDDDDDDDNDDDDNDGGGGEIVDGYFVKKFCSQISCFCLVCNNALANGRRRRLCVFWSAVCPYIVRPLAARFHVV